MASRAVVRVWRAVASKFSKEDAIEFVQNLAQEYAFSTFKGYVHDLGKPPEPMSRESLIAAHTPPDLDAIIAANKKRTLSVAEIVEPTVAKTVEKLKDAYAAAAALEEQRKKVSSTEEQDKNKSSSEEEQDKNKSSAADVRPLMNGGDEGGERRQGGRGMERGR